MEEAKRTQRFIPIQEWLSGVREAESPDYSKIDKVPMEFFVHIEDKHCSFDEALRIQKEIQSPVDIRIFTGPSALFDSSNHFYAGGRNTNRYFFY